MPNKMLWVKVGAVILFPVLLDGGGGAARPQQRSKKENMVEMGQVYKVIHTKVYTGAVDSKFTDQDFQELSNQYTALARLAEEYAKLESKDDLATMSRNLARDVQSVKNQADRKEAMLTVMLFGRAISYCAECHYQTRWPPPPSK
jgi:hypothetical protein